MPLIIRNSFRTEAEVLSLGLNSGSLVQEVSLSENTWWLLSRSPLFTPNLTNSTNRGRKLSVRRGNPPGVLWVICWCGTWAVKHPGALQEHRVTVTLSSFTVASASANRPALPLRRLHVETITEQTPLQLYLLWYLIRFVWLLFRLSAFGFCPFFIFLQCFPPNSYFAFVLCALLMSAENQRELHCEKNTECVWNMRQSRSLK